MPSNEQIQKLLKERYYLKNENSWDDISQRVSEIYRPIENYIRNKIFIPSSPTLMNANTKGEKIGTLSSCFPMRIEDSLSDIMKAMSESAEVTRMGGGVGYDFSKLRGSNEIVNSTNRTSGGPLSFIGIYNAVLDGVMQGGCFVANTYVATVNGAKKIKDIEEGDLVYTYGDYLTIRKASKAWKTKEKAEVWKLVTDKGLEIYATPDHKFMLRHGDKEYIELKDMKTGMPLKPMTRYKKDSWYVAIQDGKDTRKTEHRWLMEEMGYDIKGKDIHHKDGNHFNNNEEKKTEWKKKNSESLKLENKKRFKNGTHNWLKTHPNDDPVISLKQKKGAIANTMWKVMSVVGDLKETTWELDKHKADIYQTKKFTIAKIKDVFGSFENALEYLNERNHRVVSVGFSHYEDVYDIEVEDTHNFIVCNEEMTTGVTVSNSRRGAGMSMLDIHHNSILDFITAKIDNDRYNRSNFSVRIPDWFYFELKNNPDKTFKTTNVTDGKQNILYDGNGNEVSYKMLWDRIIESAWLSAEPGIFNSDIATRQCTVTNVDNHVLSNPCQEFTNISYASCNLGSINLTKFVKDKKFDEEALKVAVKEATRFLDGVIDKNVFPLKSIEETTLKIRPIGLGIMGLAHALFLMEMPYSSEEGIRFADELMSFITYESMKESIELAKEKGAYEAFDYDLYVKANERFFVKEEFKKLLPLIETFGVRNSSQTSIAPTGTIAYIANTSSGMEPVFALAYVRKIEKKNKDYEEVYITDDVFDAFLNTHYKEQKEEILREVVSNNGSCQNSKIMSKEHKEVFKTAGDLKPIEHLNMLEVIAKNTSLSVSKTINLPSTATKEEVGDVYLKAWEKGIIGVTVYRDGSRDGILLTKKEDKSFEADRHAPKRPKEINCEINITSIKKKQYYVVLGLLEGKPYEVFTGENYDDLGDIFIPKTVKTGVIKKKKGGKYILVDDKDVEYDISNGHSSEEADALSRQISLNLRHGTPLQYVVEQLQKYQGLHNFPKAIARTLKKFIDNNTISTEKCPECSTQLIYTDGCVSCPACGFSKCS